MKHKGAIIAILLCVAILGFFVAIKISPPFQERFAAWVFQDTPTEIKKGFSPQLIRELKEHYGITAPANAVFIKGYNTNAFRDPEIIVWFECPIDKLPENKNDTGDEIVQELLLLEKDSYSLGARTEPISKIYKEMGEKFAHTLVCNKEYDTYIDYTFDQDKIFIRFIGGHPHQQFP